MPMVTCPECLRDVSSRAHACVGCGMPLVPAEPPCTKCGKTLERRPDETESAGTGASIFYVLGGLVAAVAVLTLVDIIVKRFTVSADGVEVIGVVMAMSARYSELTAFSVIAFGLLALGALSHLRERRDVKVWRCATKKCVGTIRRVVRIP